MLQVDHQCMKDVPSYLAALNACHVQNIDAVFSNKEIFWLSQSFNKEALSASNQINLPQGIKLDHVDSLSWPYGCLCASGVAVGARILYHASFFATFERVGPPSAVQDQSSPNKQATTRHRPAFLTLQSKLHSQGNQEARALARH